MSSQDPLVDIHHSSVQGQAGPVIYTEDDNRDDYYTEVIRHVPGHRIERRRLMRRFIRGAIIALVIAGVIAGLIMLAEKLSNAKNFRENSTFEQTSSRITHAPTKYRPPDVKSPHGSGLPPSKKETATHSEVPTMPKDVPKDPEKTFAPIQPDVLKCEIIETGVYVLKPMRSDVSCVRVLQEGYDDKDLPVEVHPEHNRMIFYLKRTLDEHDKFMVFLFSEYDMEHDHCKSPVATNYNPKVYISVICPSNHGEY